MHSGPSWEHSDFRRDNVIKSNVPSCVLHCHSHSVLVTQKSSSWTRRKISSDSWGAQPAKRKFWSCATENNRAEPFATTIVRVVLRKTQYQHRRWECGKKQVRLKVVSKCTILDKIDVKRHVPFQDMFHFKTFQMTKIRIFLPHSPLPHCWIASWSFMFSRDRYWSGSFSILFFQDFSLNFNPLPFSLEYCVSSFLTGSLHPVYRWLLMSYKRSTEAVFFSSRFAK